MNFNLTPYHSVGKIKFGDDKQSIRSLFENQFSTFKRTLHSTESDLFHHHSLVVEYDSSDKCISLEFSSPSNPTSNDIIFIGEKYIDVRNKLRTLDDSLVLDESGLTSFKLGIGLYVENPEDLESVVQSVIFFSKGYYD